MVFKSIYIFIEKIGKNQKPTGFPKFFSIKNAKNGFSSKKSVHDWIGANTKVTASRSTKKYVKPTFGKKKMKLVPMCILDSTGNYKINSERINALAMHI